MSVTAQEILGPVREIRLFCGNAGSDFTGPGPNEF